MEINDELQAQIVASGFQPAPLWLEERIREALAEPARPATLVQFKRTMKAIADGR